MGSKTNPGEFDCYGTALPDEPMFVLLARDEFAPDLVELWAALRAKDYRSAKRNYKRLRSLADDRAGTRPAKIVEAEKCADDMRAFRTRQEEIIVEIDKLAKGVQNGSVSLADAMTDEEADNARAQYRRNYPKIVWAWGQLSLEQQARTARTTPWLGEWAAVKCAGGWKVTRRVGYDGTTESFEHDGAVQLYETERGAELRASKLREGARVLDDAQAAENARVTEIMSTDKNPKRSVDLGPWLPCFDFKMNAWRVARRTSEQGYFEYWAGRHEPGADDFIRKYDSIDEAAAMAEELNFRKVFFEGVKLGEPFSEFSIRHPDGSQTRLEAGWVKTETDAAGQPVAYHVGPSGFEEYEHAASVAKRLNRIELAENDPERLRASVKDGEWFPDRHAGPDTQWGVYRFVNGKRQAYLSDPKALDFSAVGAAYAAAEGLNQHGGD